MAGTTAPAQRVRQHCLRCHRTYDTSRNPVTCRIRHYVRDWDPGNSWVIRKRDKWGHKISVKYGIAVSCCGEEKTFSSCEPDSTKMGWCIVTTHTTDPAVAYGAGHPNVFTCQRKGCVHLAALEETTTAGQKRKRGE